MGQEIDRDSFAESDFEEFEQKLKGELSALRGLLDRPKFGEGPDSIGVELELNLVDARGRPLPENRQVASMSGDARVALEVDRFNLEINSRPEFLKGTPFRQLHDQIDEALGNIRRGARVLGADVAAIGILPTLEEEDLTSEVLTNQKRYRALSNGLRRLRRQSFPVVIEGAERLQVDAEDVTFEGANTSLQLHLRVPPRSFARFYNTAQLATGPLLAACCNSPLLFAHELWQETRVALFRQAVDDREGAVTNDWRPARVSFGHGWVRDSAYELFAESVVLHEPLLPMASSEDAALVLATGGVPKLSSLRLHHGTVWRWNRAVFDPTAGGHLRIELRVLPAGPTVVDMIANVAFATGLVYGLEHELDALLIGLTFGHARRNFYEAARLGLGADLVWPLSPRGGPELVRATELLPRLLHTARSGLERAGVAAQEAAHWLEIIADRISVGTTGASWQLGTFQRFKRLSGRKEAARSMFLLYQELALGGAPVHTWPEP